jgi:hypothetical protein
MLDMIQGYNLECSPESRIFWKQASFKIFGPTRIPAADKAPQGFVESLCFRLSPSAGSAVPYQGTGTKKSRFYHALSYAFVARNDSGKTMPNYSYLLGDLCSGALSNAYYPAADRGAGLVFINAARGIAGRAGQGLFQEFIARRLTKHVHEPSEKTQPIASTSKQPSSPAAGTSKEP